MLATGRAPAVHDTHACCQGPTLCHMLIQHFYHGWYIVAIPDPGVVYNNNNPLITLYIPHLHVPQFFQFPSKVKVFVLLFTLFQSYSVVSRDNKVDNFANSLSFFLLISIRSGLLSDIRWFVCTSKFRRSLCVSFSWTGARLCIYHLFVWSN